MPRPRSSIPFYRCHESSQQAIVTVRLANGERKDIYLGEMDSPQSKIEYSKILALLAANGGIYPGGGLDLTVNEANSRPRLARSMSSR